LYNKSRGHEPIRLLGLTVSQLQAYQVQGDLFSEDEETKAKVTEAHRQAAETLWPHGHHERISLGNVP
jgi:hypothetical protein